MNLDQPSHQHNYTEIGFKKLKAPKAAWEPLLKFYGECLIGKPTSFLSFALQPCDKKPPSFAQGLKFLIPLRNVMGAQRLAGILIYFHNIEPRIDGLGREGGPSF